MPQENPTPRLTINMTPSSEPFYSSFSNVPFTMGAPAPVPPPGPDPAAQPVPGASAATPAAVVEAYVQGAPYEYEQQQGFDDYSLDPDLWSPPAHTAQSPRPLAPTQPMRKKKSAGGCLTRLVFLIGIGVFAFAGLGELVDRGAEEFFSSPPPTTVADDALEEGMCLESLEYVSGNKLALVDCFDPHLYQVIHNEIFPPGPFPGKDEMRATAREICSTTVAGVNAEVGTDLFKHFAFYPTESTWNAGDRMVTCFLNPANDGDRLSGSYAEGTLDVW